VNFNLWPPLWLFGRSGAKAIDPVTSKQGCNCGAVNDCANDEKCSQHGFLAVRMPGTDGLIDRRFRQPQHKCEDNARRREP
jgi:hypothetical protein